MPRACCLLQGALFVRSDTDVGESSIILQGSRASPPGPFAPGIGDRGVHIPVPDDYLLLSLIPAIVVLDSSVGQQHLVQETRMCEVVFVFTQYQNHSLVWGTFVALLSQ